MRYIKLTQGLRAKVDDADYARLAAFGWRVVRGKYTCYAIRWTPGSSKARRLVYMHREVNRTPDGFVTDHVNGDGLDNRRRNLRTADKTQNNLNRKHLNANNTSGVHGVSRHKGTGGWQVCMRSRGRTRYAWFKTRREAVASARATGYAGSDTLILRTHQAR